MRHPWIEVLCNDRVGRKVRVKCLPEDLVGVELLAGHDDDGPLTAVPDVLPAPGFLLLQRG